MTKSFKLLVSCAFLTSCAVSVADNRHVDVRDVENDYMPESGFYIAGDFLYWKAQEDGLEPFSRTTAATGHSLLTPKLNVAAVDMSYKFRPGGRVKVGYIFGEEDQWDASLRYTRMNGRACAVSDSISADDFDRTSNLIAPAWYPFFLGSMAREAFANWCLEFNVFDATLAKNCYISPKVTMKAHAGARGAWFKQRYEANYKAVFSQTTITQTVVTEGGAAVVLPVEQFVGLTTDLNTSFTGCMTFSGGGLRAGADLVWHFNDNFSFVGEWSASLLYGRFNVSQDFLGQVEATPIGTPDFPATLPITLRLTQCMHRVRANIDLFAGLGWESFFSDDRYRASLIVGYELSEWFNQNQFLSFAGSRNSQTLGFFNNLADPNNPLIIVEASDTPSIAIPQRGDLGLQGLTIKAEFNF